MYGEHLGAEDQSMCGGVCPQTKCRRTAVNKALVLQQSATKVVCYSLAVAPQKKIDDLDDTLEHSDFKRVLPAEHVVKH